LFRLPFIRWADQTKCTSTSAQTRTTRDQRDDGHVALLIVLLQFDEQAIAAAATASNVGLRVATSQMPDETRAHDDEEWHAHLPQ